MLALLFVFPARPPGVVLVLVSVGVLVWRGWVTGAGPGGAFQGGVGCPGQRDCVRCVTPRRMHHPLCGEASCEAHMWFIEAVPSSLRHVFVR